MVGVSAGLASLVLAACGGGSGSAPASPPYGREGPASVEQLDACLASQPDDRTLLRSTVNGSLSAALGLVGQGAPIGPMINTTLIENGMIDGRPAAEEIAERMEYLGTPSLFEPYRSGSFAVYPAPRVQTLGVFQASIDACLPVTSSTL